jgi:hypothetical protein
VTRDVYRNTVERKETTRAWQAWLDDKAMPPGERSLTKLLERYRTSTDDGMAPVVRADLGRVPRSRQAQTAKRDPCNAWSVTTKCLLR